MPDFATPAGVSSPAHVQLAAVVHNPMDIQSIHSAVVVLIAGRDTVRLVATDFRVGPFRVHPDSWWGRVSRHAVALGRRNSPCFWHVGQHG